MIGRIGQYELLELLATGGMAEVYFARLRGTQGFMRLLAIKRLLPAFVHDPELVKMFLDEARLAAMLLHPNIVQVLDLGELDGAHFIAMELVDGPHVGKLLAHSIRTGREVPIAVKAHIVAQAAEGLHYAHERQDPLTGRSLSIVHRDMSPHNIIVSRFGDVKVADFGIARASIHQAQTQHGVIKGKLGYLSPEQCMGQPIDRRTDVFALGIVLYELLTSRRLYHGGKDMEVMKRIIHEEPLPPSLKDERIDINLGDIVLRALRKEPDHRYQTAGELSAALLAWLGMQRSGDLRAQLSYWVTEQAAEIWESTEVRAEKWQAEVADAPPPVGAPKEPATEQEAVGLRVRPGYVEQSRGSFIGRRTELIALRSHIERGERLLTIIGPGGVGKSRIAMRLARRCADRFATGGVWAVETGGHDTVQGLCVAVSRALKITLLSDRGTPIDQLKSALANRGATLLVLDDFEGLVDPCREIVLDWLLAAPDLVVVVTSRQRIDDASETVFELSPLALPVGDAIDASPAVHLFVARVRAVRSDYRLTAEERPVIAEIVRQLDGLPLAIELAAARMAVTSARDLLQRLTRRFEVLQSQGGVGRAGATLRGAIDWSWGALTEEEQQALTRLSLFRGGFTVAAAEAVLGHDRNAMPAMDLIESLHERSLVQRLASESPSAQPRFSLLRTIAAYAGEKLSKAERVELEDTIATWLLKHCTQLARAVSGHAGSERFLRLVDELPNLLAAAETMLRRRPRSPRDTETALMAAMSASPVLLARGPIGVLLNVLDDALRAAAELADIDPHLHAEALVCRAESLGALGRPGEGRRDAEEALLIATRQGDDPMRGAALLALAGAAAGQGRIEEGIDSCEQALAVHRFTGDDRLAGLTLDRLGRLAARAQIMDRALELHERALAVLRRAGDQRALSWALDHTGVTCLEAERLDEARTHFELALQLMQQLGAKRGEGVVRGHLAQLLIEQGELESARSEIRLALDALRGVGDRDREGRVVALDAARLILSGRPEKSVDLARKALQRAHESGEPTVVVRTHLLLAVALAACDRTREAEQAIDDASGWSGGTNRRLAVEVAMAQAHVDAAFGREVANSGHRAAAAQHLEEGELRIRRAEKAAELDAESVGSSLRLARALWQFARRWRSNP